MKTTWEITRTPFDGGGWLVVRSRIETIVNGNPDEPDGAHIQNIDRGQEHFAYTTLGHARKSIASELNLDKRVRLVKHNDTFYSYEHDAYSRKGF